MRLLRRTLSLLCLLLVILLLVVGWRTAQYLPAVPAQPIVLATAPPIDVERAARHLGEAIAWRTVSVAEGAVHDQSQWLGLHDWMQQRYPRVHAQLKREVIAELSLLYSWTGSSPELPPIVLMAHQDVVPINMATHREWAHPPFAGTVADGKVWGRGALDNKASMVALLEAVETLLAAGHRPQRTVLLLFGHDEEIGGSGVQAAVALLKERGQIPELVLDEGFMVIEQFPLTGKPAGIIGVAEKGYLTLRLRAPAAGGHSSMPPRDSGAVRLARAIVALDEQQLPGSVNDPPVSDLLRAVAADMPWLQRAALANQWLTAALVQRQLSATPAGNALLRTTTAPTMLEGSVKDNVLPQAATALVNFRIHPRDSRASVEAHVRRVVTPFAIEVEPAAQVLSAEASPIAPTNSDGYRTLEALARWAGDGAPVGAGLVLGATDARHFAGLTAAAYRFMPIVASPAEIAGFHGSNEHISVANLGRLVEGYARLISTLSPDCTTCPALTP
jgi:carboxypeptidase PM20D1